MIFDKTLYEGYGSYRLAEYVNSLGVRTHNGSKFTSTTIIRILKTRLYCGYYVSGETVSPKIEPFENFNTAKYQYLHRFYCC